MSASKLTNRFYWFNYVILFIEGAVLMGVEIAGAKWISPVYGTALYAWSAILFITLLALVLGYFTGGYLSKRRKNEVLIPFLLLATGILLFQIPWLSDVSVELFSTSKTYIGPFMSPLLYLLVPLSIMGMISPLVIQNLASSNYKSGEYAGKAYAVSTFGGVVMAILVGLYFLPEIGLAHTTELLSALIGLLSIVAFILLAHYKWSVLGVALLVAMFFLNAQIVNNREGDITIKYQNTGVLGELKVIEMQVAENIDSRFLLINRVPETNVFPKFLPYSVWPYVHRIAALASIKPAESKVLLIGMAGGTLAMELDALGMQTDIVELDERMPEVARKYFGFNPKNARVFIDDGRHYINSSSKVYDLLIIDAMDGENQPFHLYSKESFERMAKRLANDGFLILNYQGYIDGEQGIVPRSILKTMRSAGLSVKFFVSNSREGKRSGDILFVASKNDFDTSKFSNDQVNECCKSYGFYPTAIPFQTSIDLRDAFILEDQMPKLEKLNAGWTKYWRKEMMSRLYK